MSTLKSGILIFVLFFTSLFDVGGKEPVRVFYLTSGTSYPLLTNPMFDDELRDAFNWSFFYGCESQFKVSTQRYIYFIFDYIHWSVSKGIDPGDYKLNQFNIEFGQYGYFRKYENFTTFLGYGGGLVIHSYKLTEDNNNKDIKTGDNKFTGILTFSIGMQIAVSSTNFLRFFPKVNVMLSDAMIAYFSFNIGWGMGFY